MAYRLKTNLSGLHRLPARIPARDLFSAAVWAQEQTGCYRKSPETLAGKIQPSNLELMIQALGSPAWTQQQTQQGQQIREFFQSLMFQRISGEIPAGSFLDAALTVASQTEFTFRDLHSFRIAASLPHSWRTQQLWQQRLAQRQAQIATSRPWGHRGSWIQAEFLVLGDSQWSQRHQTWFTHLLWQDHVFCAQYHQAWSHNQTVMISGRVRAHRDQRVTLLQVISVD